MRETGESSSLGKFLPRKLVAELGFEADFLFLKKNKKHWLDRKLVADLGFEVAFFLNHRLDTKKTHEVTLSYKLLA